MEIRCPDLDGSPIPTGDPLLLAVNAFYAAFNGRDLAAMERVWASDGILYNPIGGIRRGWPDIRSVYERLFSGPVRVRVSFHDYSLRIDGNIAFVAGRER
ncbi:MAG: nuclear transport factor 2 family protein, partial [Nitrospirae bacterium]|nr:nuclear transport factor 2 family protein [Nitrospirota bacterium]